MLAAKEISQMTRAERLDAMERLWESLSREGVDDPSPSWHEAVLSERAKLIDSDEAVWLSVDELQTRLMKRFR